MRGSRFGWVRQAENILLIVPLSAMLLLPVLEILLRSLFHTGISGSSMIVQHLTLIVGMLGGAVAARDERLLALSPAQTLLKGRAKTPPGFSAAVSPPPSARSFAWRASNTCWTSGLWASSWSMASRFGWSR